MKATFLGVEGYPQGKRETISILLERQDYRMLLDCGGSIINQLDRSGLRAFDINAVFISHLHADHSSGLPLLLFSGLMERFEKRASGAGEVKIIGDQAILEPLISYCKAAYPALFLADSTVKASLINIDDSTPSISMNDILLESAPISHAVKGRSLALTMEGVRICYTADTRKTKALSALAKGSDLLICNVTSGNNEVAEATGFLSAAGAAQLAQEVGASKLIMLHLANDTSRQAAKKAARAIFTGDIQVPTNGDSLMIS